MNRGPVRLGVRWLLFGFFLLWCVCAGFAEPFPARSPEIAIERYRAALSQRNIEDFISCYWEDCARTVVHPDGQRIFHEGLDVLIGHQLAAFEEAEMRGEPAFEQPHLDPVFVAEIQPAVIEFMFAEPEGHFIEGFLVTERHGEWRISRQILFERFNEVSSLDDIRAWSDRDRNGMLDVTEQQALFQSLSALSGDDSLSVNPVYKFLDLDRNGRISQSERSLGWEAVFRNQVMRMYRFSPDFAREYLDFDGDGGITFAEAQHATMLARGAGEERPRPLEDSAVERRDIDENGFLSKTELMGFSDMMLRKVALLPEWYVVTASTPTDTDEVIRWIDANGDGHLSDAEWLSAGFVLRSILQYEDVVAADPISFAFDTDGDARVSAPERDAARHVFFESFLREQHDDRGGVIAAVDLDSNGRIDDIEMAQFTELFDSAQDRHGSAPRSDLEDRIDREPRNGRLDEAEIEPFITEIMIELAGMWIESQEETPNDRPQRLALSNEIVRIEDSSQPVDSSSSQNTDSSGVFVSASLDDLFPALFKHYDTAPFGAVSVTNNGMSDITGVAVKLEYPKYIDNPKECGPLAVIKPGETKEIKLSTLFNNDVLSITEGTKVSAKLTVSYITGGGKETQETTIPLNFYDRNALRWDDDEKTASFVTAKDPQIKLFVGNVIAAARDHERGVINQNLQRAMLLYSAMNRHGMTYLIDPTSSYTALSQTDLSVDYLQFPQQTLQYRTGDCDDLSVCYNTLLEAAGVQTAFITIPGHIFPAFRLDIDSSEISQHFNKADDLIVADDGTVWLPVEITALGKSFLDAWQIGAKQWRESYAKNQTALYPTETAWTTYQPVQYKPLQGSGTTLSLPDGEKVAADFVSELDRFVKREIARKELELRARLQDDPTNSRVRNRLGVLYARYGLSDKAKTEFEKILESQEYAPALLNQGNLKLLQGDPTGALTLYQRAETADPQNARAVLGIAKINHDLENYGTVANYYEKLSSMNPKLALKYSYLDIRSTTSVRSSGVANLKQMVEWDGDDD